MKSFFFFLFASICLFSTSVYSIQPYGLILVDSDEGARYYTNQPELNKDDWIFYKPHHDKIYYKYTFTSYQRGKAIDETSEVSSESKIYSYQLNDFTDEETNLLYYAWHNNDFDIIGANIIKFDDNSQLEMCASHEGAILSYIKDDIVIEKIYHYLGMEVIPTCKENVADLLSQYINLDAPDVGLNALRIIDANRVVIKSDTSERALPIGELHKGDIVLKIDKSTPETHAKYKYVLTESGNKGWIESQYINKYISTKANQDKLRLDDFYLQIMDKSFGLGDEIISNSEYCRVDNKSSSSTMICGDEINTIIASNKSNSPSTSPYLITSIMTDGEAFQTTRGIHIYDTFKDVTRAYGHNYIIEKNDDQSKSISYAKQYDQYYQSLIFSFRNDKLISIELKRL